jgi:hypothetical protein
MLLRGGLAAGAGLAIAGLGTFGLSKAAEALTFDTQFDWAFCISCAGLWYTNNNTAGVCEAGTGHVKSPSFSYELRYNISGSGGPSYQAGWDWCSACQCLFYANVENLAKNNCPAGGHHTFGGFAYSVLYNDVVTGSSQGNWWWCGLCQGLFNAAGGVGGACPGNFTGGPHNSGPGSYKYDVSYYSTSSP